MRRASRRGAAGALLIALLLPLGCGAGTATTTVPGTSPGAQPTGSAATATSAARRPRHPRRPPRHHPAAPAPTRRRSGALADSTASNDIVQAQPPAGSCHAIGSGLDSRPDPACTPGALNPAVTQATIQQTICVAGWTATVRPPERVTEPEKLASLRAYGDPDAPGEYEYDHLVALELGGATNDPRNLWPEPGASPNPKDTVEGDLRRAVCAGQMTLTAAQRAIATNWTTAAGPPSSSPAPPSPTPPSPAPSASATCTATASYSARYHDYDVYVHSDQPNRTVTVSDNHGHSDSWHTDASGYADVYLKTGGPAPGRPVTVHVGAATCSTTL